MCKQGILFPQRCTTCLSSESFVYNYSAAQPVKTNLFVAENNPVCVLALAYFRFTNFISSYFSLSQFILTYFSLHQLTLFHFILL